MIQGKRTGRPKKPLEQKRSERVVTLLTPEERQWLKGYTGQGSISQALREAISILFKLGLEDRRERKIDRLSDLDSFIYEFEEKLRKGDIELTIESRRAVIKIKGGHISFRIPQKPVKKEIGLQTLKELERKCESLMEGPLTGEFIFQDDRFKYVASRIMEVSGYERERLLSKSVFDLVYPDDRRKVKEIAREVLEGKGIPSQFRFRPLTKDGKIIYVNASLIPIEYEGRPAIAGSLTDLTEWEELPRDLERLEAMLAK